MRILAYAIMPNHWHLAQKCENWQWGSASKRLKQAPKFKSLLDPPPTPLPLDYHTWINTPDKEDDLSIIRHSVNKGVPYGRERWVDAMVEKYHLEPTRRVAGRPRKLYP